MILKEERQLHSSRTTQSQTNLLSQDKKSYLNKLIDDQGTPSPTYRRKTYRNPTLARLHMESETELTKNERTVPKATKFYDVLQLEDCFRTNAILNLALCTAASQFSRRGRHLTV